MFASNINLHVDNNYRETVYFLHSYFPVKHFNWRSLDRDSVEFRSNLFAFKDGSNHAVSRIFTNEVIAAIGRLAPDFNSSGFAFMAMPASTENKTVARYSLMLSILKNKFPRATFLNDYVTFNGERKAKHLSENGISDLLEHVEIGGDVEGKKVIIFDDVITTGRSMEEMKRRLKQIGATDFICLTLGRTVDYRKLEQ